MSVEYIIEVSDEDDQKLEEIAEKRGLDFDIGVIELIEEAIQKLIKGES